MEEGQATPQLVFIARGAASVEKGGTIVGVCGPGDFLGEMSFLTGKPASATVRVANEVRCCVYDPAALKALAQEESGDPPGAGVQLQPQSGRQARAHERGEPRWCDIGVAGVERRRLCCAAAKSVARKPVLAISSERRNRRRWMPRPVPDPDYEERVRASFARQAAMATIGAELTLVTPGIVEIEMPYSAALTQQHGFLHAGVISTALDSACGYAAFSLMPEHASVLTIEFKVNLLAPGKGERFLFRGSVDQARPHHHRRRRPGLRLQRQWRGQADRHHDRHDDDVTGREGIEG